jgi:hypothetical protein
MYSILTGVAPFADVSGKSILERVIAGQIKPPREINPTIPEALHAICLKALAKNQSDRYPTAACLAQDLELWLSDETVSAFREPWTDRAARFMRRHRTLAISSIAVLLTALLALLVINTLVRNQNGNLKIERDMAEASRQEAIQEKRRAEENLGVARTTSLNMLTTAEERLSGSSISSQTALSLRMMLTEQAYTSFQTLYDQNENDRDLAFEFAQTSRISANLKRLVRDLKSADEQIEKSLRIQLQTPVDQLSLKRKDYLAETYRDIATLRRVEGRLEDAEVALKAGTELIKELQAIEPENPEFMRTHAVIEVEEIGLHSDRLELDLALRKANSSAATFQKLMDTGMSIPMDASVLMMARSRQMLLLFKLGRLDEAKPVDQPTLAEQLDARLGQFPPNQAGQGTTDQARHDGEQQVEGADVLVIGRQEPAGEETRLVVMMPVVVVDEGFGCGGHSCGALAVRYWAAGATAGAVAGAAG